MFKKITIALILMLVAQSNLYSQKQLKYKHVYSTILQGNKEISYSQLLQFQRQDPDFANAYFQLGIIAKYWSEKYDPLTDTRTVNFFIYNTDLYFGLAKLKLKDEKRKNRKYYTNIKIESERKKPTYEEIEKYIDKQLEENNIYKENLEKITFLFNKSVDKYNKCSKIFMDINRNYSKIKNIYLSEDDRLKNKINELETAFDSTIYYLKKYRQAITEYPIANYNQKFNLKKIITYRLDGLTGSNFLKNNITLWDYKTWIKEVRNVVRIKIKSNRDKILAVSTILDAKISFLQKAQYSDSYKPYKLKKKTVYQIEKYDYNSLVVRLLRYKESQVNYLLKFKETINDPQNSTKTSLKKMATYNRELLDLRLKAEQNNSLFYKRIIPSEVRKNKNFYLKYYSGMTGLKQYSEEQLKFYKLHTNKALLNLKTNLLHRQFEKIPNSLVPTYRKKNIPVYEKYIDVKLAEPDKYYTLGINKDKDGNIYLTGFYKSKKEENYAFLAYIESKSAKISFLKKLSKNTVSYKVKSYDEGCFIVYSEKKDEILKNYIKQFDIRGKELLTKELPFSDTPKYLDFDEINNTLIIVFKPGNKIESKETVFVLNLDESGNSFKTELNISGEVFDIVKMDKQYFIFNNCTAYKDVDGTHIKTKATDSKSNILLTIINSTGDIEKNIFYTNKKSCFGIKTVKINSNLLNVLGTKNEVNNQNYKTLKNNNLFYSLINKKAKQIYSNWHD